MADLLDVTDLVEFLVRGESASGVQRVIAETAPRLLTHEPSLKPVVLDRSRGAFVELSRGEIHTLLLEPHSRDDRARAAAAALLRAGTAQPIEVGPQSVAVFLGAVWIADALMLAARELHSRGARLVFLLYDLTPVLETGHTAGVNRLFERYLHLVLECASVVPSISQSSRDDLIRYAQDVGLAAPAGRITGLPCGIAPGQYDTENAPWPRKFALFVGTIESRKNHLLALEAWRALIERHGADEVPDLVCVGRLGWHSDAFLAEYVATHGLDGKVSILTNSLSDEALAAVYAHCEFTVYPSRYEGWGLPVSESLAFGKVAVTARNSSLTEAGGELASYFTTDDVSDFVSVIERDGLNVENRHALEAKIAHQFHDISWDHVAQVIAADVAYARSAPEGEPVFAPVKLGREYMLAPAGAAPDPGYADQYLHHLQTEGLTPLMRQPRGSEDFVTTDAALTGSFGSPQAWGNELRPSKSATLRITRPVDGGLVVLFSTRSMPGVVNIEGVGPGGPIHEAVALGSVVTLPLGDGSTGEPAQVTLTVTDATDSIEGFMGLRSFVILKADDTQSQLIALKAAADALRQELDFIQGTRSWKITAPLRKMKGRGA